MGLGKKVYYELIERENNIRLAYDCLDNISSNIFQLISMQTYIDKFVRLVTIEFGSDQEILVTTRTSISYANLKEGVTYYSSNPRFIYEKDARSHKNLEFRIDGIDYTEQVRHEIVHVEEKRWPFIVRNNLPLKELMDNKVEVLHKPQYLTQINKFYQLHQIIYPCRDYQINVLLKNNLDKKYTIAMGSFFPFNTLSYKNFRSEQRNDDLYQVHIPKWTLPGSGYSFTIQKHN